MICSNSVHFRSYNHKHILFQIKRLTTCFVGVEQSLKECMNEDGVASVVIQFFLNNICRCYIHVDVNVRKAVVKVLNLVLEQGLVHPINIVPFLIAMNTDNETAISGLAEKLLKGLYLRQPVFLTSKFKSGIEWSLQLQKLIQGPKIRGHYRLTATHHFFYMLLQNKQHRRAFVLKILKCFEVMDMESLLYFADNLAYFPYTVEDEVLYILYHIDAMVSITGTNFLTNLFGNGANCLSDLDEDNEETFLLAVNSHDIKQLQKKVDDVKPLYLLMELRQYLQNTYGLTDSQVMTYMLHKNYNVSLINRGKKRFEPKSSKSLNISNKDDIVQKYLEFKRLMFKFELSNERICEIKNNGKRAAQSCVKRPIKRRRRKVSSDSDSIEESDSD